jgi:hypothetical protein
MWFYCLTWDDNHLFVLCLFAGFVVQHYTAAQVLCAVVWRYTSTGSSCRCSGLQKHMHRLSGVLYFISRPARTFVSIVWLDWSSVAHRQMRNHHGAHLKTIGRLFGVCQFVIFACVCLQHPFSSFAAPEQGMCDIVSDLPADAFQLACVRRLVAPMAATWTEYCDGKAARRDVSAVSAEVSRSLGMP